MLLATTRCLWNTSIFASSDAFMSMLKGYRPSSALQAIFPYNMEPLMTVYKTLYELVQLYFYQKVFCMIVVPVPNFACVK